MTLRAADMLVCDYVTYFIVFLDYQSQSTQAPLQPITMDPHSVTIPNDDDVVTFGAVFENPFLYFLCVWDIF